MSVMTFVLETLSTDTETSTTVSRSIATILATSLSDAKQAYQEQSKRCNIRFHNVIDVTETDYRVFTNIPNNTYISTKAKSEFFFRPLDPIPPHANPFHHDAFHMGTDLPRDWMIMSQGFDSQNGKRPLEYMILINMRTGQRWELYLRDELNEAYQDKGYYF